MEIHPSSLKTLCSACTPEKLPELPGGEDLYEDVHDFALLLKCADCGQRYLEYWVEIFDDAWMYFVAVNDEEAEGLKQAAKTSNEKFEMVKFIRTKAEVICRYPTGGFKVQPGQGSMLDGPPW